MVESQIKRFTAWRLCVGRHFAPEPPGTKVLANKVLLFK